MKEEKSDVFQILQENGYEDVVVLRDYDYSSALIAVTDDGRAVYDYNKMVEWLMQKENMEDTEAIEWIEYNTIRSLPYAGDNAPIIIHLLEDMA